MLFYTSGGVKICLCLVQLQYPAGHQEVQGHPPMSVEVSARSLTLLKSSCLLGPATNKKGYNNENASSDIPKR